MPPTALLADILVKLEVTIDQLREDVNLHRARHDDAQALGEQTRQELVGAAAALANANSESAQAAADSGSIEREVDAAAGVVSNARANHARAAQAVIDHEEPPDPPEPPASRSEMDAWKRRLKAWQDKHAELTGTEQNAAAVLAAAQISYDQAFARLAASRVRLAQLRAAVTAATATQSDTQNRHDAALASQDNEARIVAGLTEQHREHTARRDRYRHIVEAIAAERFARGELEVIAQELADWLRDLRRQRRLLIAGKEEAADALRESGRQHSESSSEFDTLRRELDGEFRFMTDGVAPAQCVTVLDQAVADAEARAKRASELQDETSAKLVEHRRI
jgi:hypothetical protein